MPVTGTKSTPTTFQIDTATTCNTLSDDALLSLMPNMKLTKSPFTGQIDLLCEQNKRFQTLTFLVLSRDTVMNKTALLSGSDCKKLGIIKITADEI